MYIPQNCTTLDKLKERQQIRLGIQGYPKTGKTWGALTFPNPVVLDFDRGLGAHEGRSDVVHVPFYDESFIKTIYPTAPKNRKDALQRWIETEAIKLEKDQTLILDGITGVQSAYDQWVKANGSLFISKKGVYDEREPWNVKLAYFDNLAELLKSLKCHVICICHEIAAKDKSTGEYTGKIRPLLSGQFGDKLVGHFTDWVRQHATDKPKELDEVKIKAAWNMSKVEFQAMLDTFPRHTLYYWQLENDDYADCGCSSLVKFPRFIPANYENFNKYMRKIV